MMAQIPTPTYTGADQRARGGGYLETLTHKKRIHTSSIQFPQICTVLNQNPYTILHLLRSRRVDAIPCPLVLDPGHACHLFSYLLVKSFDLFILLPSG